MLLLLYLLLKLVLVMQVWLPLQPKEDKSKSKGFLSKRIMLPFAVDIYPLGMLSPFLQRFIYCRSLITAFRHHVREIHIFVFFNFLKFCCFNIVFIILMSGVGWGQVCMGGMSPGCFLWVLLKRSIPKPDQHRKDIIQQESLGLICYRN